jgi:hypothetical protein
MFKIGIKWKEGLNGPGAKVEGAGKTINGVFDDVCNREN